ncbi:MAG: hypothetical protein KA201_39380 [Kofleriaceae bacterium]|nr:hypothetical protein [Kofleriaceae bacterium]
MKNGRLQAKDLNEDAILEAIERLRWTPWPGGETDPMPRWVFVDELIRAVDPSIPYKLMLAKLSAMDGRDLVSGCFCGCRGDIELPDHGEARADRERGRAVSPTPPAAPPRPAATSGRRGR